MSTFPGKAALRFFNSQVIYGPNAEVFFYGPAMVPDFNRTNPLPPTLIDNPFTSAVHYYSHPNNTSTI